jgi:double-stranded uracil-DNA glycosylase
MTDTLPDLLREDLDVIFVGINPSLFSVAQGHYFARRTNRFWPSLSRSLFSLQVRQALGVERLEPIHDHLLLGFGIGFTDLVKRPTANAADLSRAETAAGAEELVKKLQHYQPRIVCFHGVTAYRPFAAQLGSGIRSLALGEQLARIGKSRLFVVPNPSPANAHATLGEQTAWYDRVAAMLVDRAG